MTFLTVVVHVLAIIATFSCLEASGKKIATCPDGVWGNETWTIEQVLLKNLKTDGPEDGICKDNKDKWIISGKLFNLPPRCACLTIPKGENIRPETKSARSIRCPNMILASLQETFKQYWKRIYETLEDVAIEDGWCPKKSIKWIIKGDLIGKPKDFCGCIKNYTFYSRDVKIPKSA